MSMQASLTRALGRKGMVFLVSALLLVGIFLTIMFARTLPTSEERMESEIARVQSMVQFINDFHADIPRATEIAGFRAFIAIEEYINKEGTFVTNATPVFIEAFMNGTIDGEPYDILANSTFSEYLRRVNQEAADVGIVLDATVIDVSLNQSTPWSVDITFEIEVNVSDDAGLARWDYVRTFDPEVSIIDIRDPVYSVYTYGRVPNTFRVSPYNNSDFVSGNDTTLLNTEVLEMYYREDPHAPSFLQRLQGKLSASNKYGIASPVNLDELDAQGIFPKTYLSVLDYQYFVNASTTNYCPDFGSPLPSWFKVDQTHYLDPEHDFELDDLNATIC